MNNGVQYHTSNNYKRDKKAKNAGIDKNLVIIGIVSLLILTGFIYIRSNQMQVIQADYGEVIDGFETRALIVRREEIFKAPVSGRLFLDKKEGTRVQYDQKVARIKNNDQITQLYSKKAGLISYAVDGLEKRLQPFKLNQLGVEGFSEMERNFSQHVDGNRVVKGDAVYRIIDNFQLYIVVETSNEEIQRYQTGELVFIDPLGFDTSLIEGTIKSREMSDEQGLLVISLNRFISEWLNARWVKIRFIKNIHRGIVIPRKAIFSQPAGEGVLIYSSSGRVVFKEIKITAQNSEQAVVSGLEVGDRVIGNPEAYKYGRGG